MRTTYLFMALYVGFTCVALADEPSSAPVQPSTAALTPAAATPNDASDNASTSEPEKTAAQLKREAAEASIRAHGAMGYKPEKKSNGEVVYCIRETAIGSKFETKRCRSFESLRDEAVNAKDYTEQMQHFGWRSGH